jgi:hypothetical protein
VALLSEQEVEKRLNDSPAGRSRPGHRSNTRSATFPRPSPSSTGSCRIEAADHHPDIFINYRRVALLYSTHSEGGLTLKDFEGAAMADRNARSSATTS